MHTSASGDNHVQEPGHAVTAAAVVLKTAPDADATVAEIPPKPERGGGYRLSAHVQQYYKTTRL